MKTCKRFISLALCLLLLCCTAPLTALADGETDPEGGSFEEAYSLPLGNTYYGRFAENDRVDYFKIQTPDYDTYMQFNLNYAVGVSYIFYAGSTGNEKKYEIFIYDSDFQQIGYAYASSVSRADITLPLEKTETYYVRIRRGYAFSNPTIDYLLNVFIEHRPTSIAIATLPTKTVYHEGESFNGSGLTLTETFSDGSKKTITSGFSISGFDSATAGTKTVTVTYGGKTATFTVTVEPLCEHAYTSAVTTAATCTADGVRTYTCSKCGSSYTETIPATGHAYSAVVTKQPSCQETGVRKYTCSACGSSYTETIAKTAHTPQTVTEPATCQATGKQYTKCAVCGETLSAVTVLPKTDHTYNAVVTKQPSCQETGVTTYTCAACGDSYTEVMEKTAHTPQDVTEPATCQAEGKQYTKCAVCGEILSDVTVLPITDHTPGAAVKDNETPATCTEAGGYEEVVRCMYCGVEMRRTTVSTPASGHSFTNYVYNNDATTEKDGTKTAKCDRCSATDTVPAPGTKLRPSTVAIQNYAASKTVDYRATVTFTAVVTNPSGGTVHWFIDGKDAGTGETYTAKEVKEKFTVQAKYMQSGKVLAESETETVKVNAGFFARLKAFFRALFGKLPVVVQEYLGVEFIDRVLP